MVRQILDMLTKIIHRLDMKALTVAEVKTHFSELLVQVKNGERVKILYGKSKKPVAMIVPLGNADSPRRLGALEGIAKFKEIGNTMFELPENIVDEIQGKTVIIVPIIIGI